MLPVAGPDLLYEPRSSMLYLTWAPPQRIQLPPPRTLGGAPTLPSGSATVTTAVRCCGGGNAKSTTGSSPPERPSARGGPGSPPGPARHLVVG
jgi:hypothetical protein